MSKVDPIVSIIVPNYNHQQYLVQRLDSVFAQTFTDFEVILLDDASTDDSPAILKKYAKHPKVSHCIFNQKNSGSVFQQWQKGIELAQGKYIWIAESDDWADKYFLASLVPAFEDTSVVLAYTQSYRIDETGKVLHSLKKWTEDLATEIWETDFVELGQMIVNRFMVHKNVIPNASAVLIRTDTLKKITIPTAMQLCGDMYVWVQVLRKGNLAFIANPLNYFRSHEHTTRQYDSIKNRHQYIFEQLTVLDQIRSEIEQTEISQKIDQRVWALTLGWLNFAGLKHSWNYRKTIPLTPLLKSRSFYQLAITHFLKKIGWK